MDATVYCLVDAAGRVYMQADAESHAEVSAAFRLSGSPCDEYRFDLSTRRLLVDRGQPVSARAAQMYIDQHLGTPERLVTFAKEGHLPKRVLVSFLAEENRQSFLEACARVEKKYTDDCAAKNDPCIGPACAVEGEICLEPLLRVGTDYFHQVTEAQAGSQHRSLNRGESKSATAEEPSQSRESRRSGLGGQWESR